MATALDHYEDFISCTICLLPFEGRDPRLLPCPSGAHPFCMVCIQSVYDTAIAKDPTKKNSITCPKCQTSSQIPGGNFGNLPRYIQCGQVTDLWKQMAQEMAGNGPEDIKVCSICKTSEISTYCFSCTKRLCVACESSHGSTRLFQNHIKVDVTKDTIKSLVCSEHDLMIIAYCSACWKAVCTKCMITSHRDHATEDFVVKQQTVNPIAAVIKNKEDSLASQQTLLDAMLPDFDDHEQKTDALIKAQKAKLIQRIEAEEQVIRKKLQQGRLQIQTRLSEATGDLNDATQLLQETKTKSQNITNPILGIADLSLARGDQLLSEVQRNISTLQTKLPWNDQQSFAQDETSLIAFGVQTHVRVIPDVSAPIVKHLLPHSQWATQRVPNYIRLKPDVMFLEDLPDKHVGGFFPDGSILLFTEASFFGGYSLTVYSVHNRSISYVDWQDVIPGDNGHGEVLCSFNTRAHIFAFMQYEEITIVSATGDKNVSTTFDVCNELDSWFIGVESDNKVVICVGHRRQIRQTSRNYFHWELVEYSEMGHKLRQQALSHACDVLIVGSEDTLFISDGDPQPITYVYDKQWQILRSLHLGIRCPQYLPNIRGSPINYICTDSSGNILLADFDGHVVKLFDSQGQFVTNVVDLGGGSPSDIFLYQDRYLVVGVYSEGFRVYDLQRN